MTVKSFYAFVMVVFLCVWAAPTRAAEMQFPVVCEAGLSCFIMGYPDVDRAADSAKDYACGPATSEGNPFLRIGLTDLATITLGIPVVAAADGRVIDATDGVADLAAAAKSQIKKGTPVCGNGVVIDHGQGRKTGYCHLRRGSVTVKKGDVVVQGQVIGLVGQSGVATWPELGFSISDAGTTIDPITGSSAFEGCGFKARKIIALPDAFKTYQPAAITTLGFADRPQTANAVALGKALRLVQITPEAMTITMWGMIAGVKKGDRIETRLRGPNGRTFDYQDLIADTDKDRQLINVNRTRGYSNWRTGIYKGEVTLTRTIDAKPYSITRGVTVVVE